MDIIRGHVADPLGRRTFDGKIGIEGGRIAFLSEDAELDAGAPFILPGFVDSHVHVESSMMLPHEFARLAVSHGSVGAVCDPHEIANVLGEEGIGLMLRSAAASKFRFAFGAPSCVPACGGSIETSGFTLDAAAIERLMQRDDIYFLGEMMNFPGVLAEDPSVMAKIAAAAKAGKPVDGHAPGLTGEQRRRYAAAGIATDHECSTLEEASDAIAAGMKVLIREGSAARNYRDLSPLLDSNPDSVMFCTDDSHPGDLHGSHVDRMVRAALKDGYGLMDILRAACVNPVLHYGLPVGLLRAGDRADFIVISDLTPEFKVLGTYIGGERVFPEGDGHASGESSAGCAFQSDGSTVNFKASPVTPEMLRLPSDGVRDIIEASDGSLLTGHLKAPVGDDVQKLVVYNRYVEGVLPQMAFIKGFGMERGAIAQTIAHDCHNIVAVGTSDEMLAEAINKVVEMKGGIAVTDGNGTLGMPLPVGGIMSDLDAGSIVAMTEEIDGAVRRTGCTLKSPLITLAFMALPVIPALKLTDKGLFNAATFRFVER